MTRRAARFFALGRHWLRISLSGCLLLGGVLVIGAMLHGGLERFGLGQTNDLQELAILLAWLVGLLVPITGIYSVAGQYAFWNGWLGELPDPASLAALDPDEAAEMAEHFSWSEFLPLAGASVALSVAGISLAVLAYDLHRIDLQEALRSQLDWDHRKRLDAMAPQALEVPSGSTIRIDYASDEPVLAVRLQEMFGLADTPAIAGGRMPLLLHLLSPARRPVQVTRDLRSFWKNAYPEVKKDLKGRYPKHHWPDDPWTATPTARIKPRGS
jgi:hypothetical protein